MGSHSASDANAAGDALTINLVDYCPFNAAGLVLDNNKR